ncbi:MAG: class I SAM-dependent methyltransferase [Deltaproteobacteria bacterium]|jgi:SAM-dependent methyltransferase|nr:class I SAM-dependent methyltransferase [Deltaproteobacteria bacterium]
MESVKISDQKTFWDKRAKTFPRYSPGEGNYEAIMLNHAKNLGVVFADKTILDVGAGAGMYTLRLAMEAKKVVALDISPEMLSISRTDAENVGISNIEYLVMDWADYQPQTNFDVLFCAMTPALGSLEGREKVLTFPGATVVFMGFSDPQRSNIMQQLFDFYNLSPQGFTSSPEFRAFLDLKKISYQTLSHEGEWTRTYTFSEISTNCESTLALRGLPLNPNDLTTVLEKFSDGKGGYVEKTAYQVEVIVFRNPV